MNRTILENGAPVESSVTSSSFSSPHQPSFSSLQPFWRPHLPSNDLQDNTQPSCQTKELEAQLYGTSRIVRQICESFSPGPDEVSKPKYNAEYPYYLERNQDDVVRVVGVGIRVDCRCVQLLIRIIILVLDKVVVVGQVRLSVGTKVTTRHPLNVLQVSRRDPHANRRHPRTHIILLPLSID